MKEAPNRTTSTLANHPLLLQGMFLTIGIIIAVSLQLSSARNDHLSKNYQFPNQNLVLADASFDNKTLFYALFAQSTKQCSVIQEINPFTNHSITKQCKFAIKADAVQLVVNLGAEKAVLITQETTSKTLKLKATTVHISDCKTVDAEIVEVPLDWKTRKMYRNHIDVVVSTQGFEVIIKGLSRLCTKPDAQIYCGVSFSAEGNKIEGPLIWPKMAYEKIDIVSPVMADATGQGYFFVNRDDSSLLAFQLNRKGGPKFVKLWYTPTNYSNRWREGYSVANEVDGMCYNSDSTIGCWQTDRKGELKINTEFEFDPAFKANLKSCNTTKDSTTQITKVEDSSTQDSTTQSTTIEMTTKQQTLITTTSLLESMASETTVTETIKPKTESTTSNETVILGITEDNSIEPITVQGITAQEITTQAAATQNTTMQVEGNATVGNIIQVNATSQENTTEITATQEITTEDPTIHNNDTGEATLDAGIVANSTSEGAMQEITAIDDVILNNATEGDAMLENTTEHSNVQDMTVQGLTAATFITQENTTESTISEVTVVQNASLAIVTDQGITTQSHTTQKTLALRSLAQVKTPLGKQIVWNLFIHNLNNGGFIMLIITCPDGVCSGTDDHYYLLKINASGKRVGQLEVNIESKCNPGNGHVWAKVIENDQGQYCAVRLCEKKLKQEEQLETLVSCYCNSDFK